MRTTDQEKEWQEWLSTRPNAVRAMAELYPPGTTFESHGKTMFLCGYGERATEVVLLVSTTNPAVDYEGAMETRQPICSCCLPTLEKKP